MSNTIPIIPVIPVIRVEEKSKKRLIDEIVKSEDSNKLQKLDFDDEDDKFNQRIPLEEIEFKQELAYVSTGHIINTANELLGRFNWKTEVLQTELHRETNSTETHKVGCSILLRLTVTDKNGKVTIHEEWGYGEGVTKNELQNIGKSKKHARSDALKRSLRNIGKALGLDLCLSENKKYYTKSNVNDRKKKMDNELLNKK